MIICILAANRSSYMFHALGKYIMLIRSSFHKPENYSMYWKEMIREMESVGVNSLGIVAIISVFLGAVTCVQTAYQLVSAWVPTYVIGQIVRDSTLLELSPTVACLVLAGKVGSNFSSQIGTMRVTEQIDALRIMGVNPPGFLIMPKLVASIIMVPLLVTFSIAIALMGGLIAGHVSGAISIQDYVYGIRADFVPFMLMVALIKAFIFGFIISTVSSYFGYFTKGGALDVGRSSTKAVVYSCIIILFADYIVAQILL
ncbi:MAG: phospholipid/cholesterol/gamma-HCH transport system permease protein [Sphingobacteriales bacterium]|jgi:phospholipid/cholesterol/gamma-HCH transport system permease protein